MQLTPADLSSELIWEYTCDKYFKFKKDNNSKKEVKVNVKNDTRFNGENLKKL
jgi:hypothetical protein